MGEKEDDNFWNWDFVLKLILGGILAIYLWFIAFRFIFSKKVSKGALAKEYGVENKILMKWLKLFGSEEGIELYHGKQVRNVKRAYFTAFLGEPNSGPKHKNKPLIKKEDIWKALDSNETAVRDKIKAIENPKEIIGMSYATYKSLTYLPPTYMSRVVDFLEDRIPQEEEPSQDFFDENRS